MEYKYEAYDVAVIGAGHAGCEAALACARLGLKTIIFTISVESIAMMPTLNSNSEFIINRNHQINEKSLLPNKNHYQEDSTTTQIFNPCI